MRWISRAAIPLAGLSLTAFCPKAGAHHRPLPTATTYAWVLPMAPDSTLGEGGWVDPGTLAAAQSAEYRAAMFLVKRALEDQQNALARAALGNAIKSLQCCPPAAPGAPPIVGSMPGYLPGSAADAGKQPGKPDSSERAARQPAPDKTDLGKELNDITARVERLEQLLLRHEAFLRQQRGER